MRRRTAGAIGVAMLGLVLTGCGPTAPDATEPPSPSASSTPSESSTPTAAPAALTIPDCETLLPIDQVHAIFGDSLVFYGEEGFDASGFAIPQLGTTLAGADQSRRCIWVIPDSDGSFQVIVAKADPSDAAALQAVLPGEGFTSASMGTVTGFDGVIATDDGDYATTVLFTGDVIIYVSAGTLEVTGQTAAVVLDALRTANPDLGL
jgi:hypothetical protein